MVQRGLGTTEQKRSKPPARLEPGFLSVAFKAFWTQRVPSALPVFPRPASQAVGPFRRP